MCQPQRRRNAFTLLEVLVALAIATLGATIAMAAWQRTQEAASLRQGQMQVAAVYRDAIAQVAAMPPGSVAEVVFWPASNQLAEYVATPGQSWQTVQPAGAISLWLPPGVTVLSYTFQTNAMRVFNGDTSTGTYQALNASSWPGQVTLQTTHGMTATVNVTRAGTVWY